MTCGRHVFVANGTALAALLVLEVFIQEHLYCGEYERAIGVVLVPGSFLLTYHTQSLTARAHKVTDPAEFESVFRTVRSENVGAIQVLSSPFFDGHRRQLIELAARYRLPAVYEFKNYVQDGGLMSYDPNNIEMFVRTAKSDPISLDTVSTTMTGAKEVDDGNEQAEADSWQ